MKKPKNLILILHALPRIFPRPLVPMEIITKFMPMFESLYFIHVFLYMPELTKIMHSSETRSDNSYIIM